MTIETYTHIAQEIVTAVTRQFGDEAGIQIDESDIIRWINQGQREIISNNTSINQAMAQADLVANQAQYPLDADSVFAGIQNIVYVTIKGKPLKNMTFQEAMTYLTQRDTPATGDAQIWYTRVGLLNLYPIPSENIVGGLQIYFTKAPKTIEASGDKLGIPDNFYNALIQYVLQQAYELDENFQAAGVKAQQFDKSVNIQQNQTIDQNAFFPTIQGDPEDWL